MELISEDEFYGTELEQIWDTYDDYMDSYIMYWEDRAEELKYGGI